MQPISLLLPTRGASATEHVVAMDEVAIAIDHIAIVDHVLVVVDPIAIGANNVNDIIDSWIPGQDDV